MGGVVRLDLQQGEGKGGDSGSSKVAWIREVLKGWVPLLLGTWEAWVKTQ